MISYLQQLTAVLMAPVMSLLNNTLVGWLAKHFCIWWQRKRPPTQGSVAPGFEPVAALFRKNFENGVEQSTGGSAFSVYYKGSKVVDLWGGFADTTVRQLWEEDTMTVIFSATKGIAALCMSMLVDRGQLDFDQTVAFYWPEFAQRGKEKITVRMLLNHEAGLAATAQPISFKDLKDQDALGRLLAESPPCWPPGTGHGYHAFTFGLYCSQLLMRVDPQRRTLGQFFKDEVAEPFDIDIHIGLPLELNYRVARLTGILDFPYSVSLSYIPRDVVSWLFIWAFVTGRSFIHEVIQKATDMAMIRKMIKPQARALENPSSSGIGTARAAAKVYGILANGGQPLQGQRLLSKKLVEDILAEAGPPSLDKVVAIETNFSNGYALFDCEGSRQFGHHGAGGQQCVADPQYKLGIAYVSSHFSPYGFGNDPRFLSLQKATYKCVRDLQAKPL
ncbi:beta-lactamase domain-containing protein 2-like [Patiria miniata]|uniref:Beta-lactamase-related domain-containing protein n=1 Tax=Patiria miniata TaxID=46514 RepID=A0A913Z8X7_PATMI|nr:beta-lactamase domain-containing protein 2-like [Patiria miniata]